MRLTPRSLILAPALLAAVALTPTVSMAERLQVPFSFSIGNNVLPAGTYDVQGDLHMSTVRLSTPDAKKSFTWIIGPGDASPFATGVTLRFDQSGDGYTLRDIQYRALTTRRIDKHRGDSEDRPVHVIRG